MRLQARLANCPPIVVLRFLRSTHALAESPSEIQPGDAGSAFLPIVLVVRWTSHNDLHAAAAPSSGPVGLPLGGRMLFTTALVLLAGWLLGVFGAYIVGPLAHLLLLLWGAFTATAAAMLFVVVGAVVTGCGTGCPSRSPPLDRNRTGGGPIATWRQLCWGTVVDASQLESSLNQPVRVPGSTVSPTKVLIRRRQR